MIQNRWVFDDEYNTQILHRNDELQSLSRLLEPATHGRRAEDALIYGPSGVGKTATTRWLLRDLYQRANVQSAGIECSGATSHEIIHEAVYKHPSTGIVHQNQSRDDLLEMLAEIADRPYVVILDEADVIPDLDVLGDLLEVELVSVIAIAHEHVEWLNRVDRNLRSCFHGESQIEFRKYQEHELVDILKPRVEHGLIGHPVTTEQLEWIADETSGVARWAIQSVLAAAELAEERNHDRFREQDVRDSFERAKTKMRKANLQSLPVVYGRVYELVRATGPATGDELKAAYREHQDEIFEGQNRNPVTWRQAWNYLSKLADYDLIEMPGETNSKVYEVVDKELEAPVEFDVSGIRASMVDL